MGSYSYILIALGVHTYTHIYTHMHTHTYLNDFSGKESDVPGLVQKSDTGIAM